MARNQTRRNFLRADFARDEALRPYGAVATGDFQRLCDGCGDCIAACPEAVIGRDAAGRAALDFSAGACTFCGDCIEACPTGALALSARDAWTWLARIEPGCLSLNAVYCRTCKDFCDAGAIGFTLQTGGRARPTIDVAACTGCGACAGACPAGAVTFERQDNTELETTG